MKEEGCEYDGYAKQDGVRRCTRFRRSRRKEGTQEETMDGSRYPGCIYPPFFGGAGLVFWLKILRTWHELWSDTD